MNFEAIAHALGVHKNTIAKLSNGETQLTQQWMQRLGDYFGVAPEELISKSSTGNARRVRVSGQLQAGEWSEGHEWPREDQYEVLVPDDPSLRHVQLYACEVRGNSMNLLYPEGSVAVLSRVGGRSDIVPGRRYHVRATKADGLTEETLKSLVRGTDGRYWLKPESTDPAFQQWISLDGEPGMTIELIGRVRFSIKSEDEA